MDSDLVRHSRAGDAFHYRWAARRCLRMIDPRCPVKQITVEASIHPLEAGECVIDLAEYYKKENGNLGVHYYQLKHSTLRLTKKLDFTDAKKTIEGFAARFAVKSRRGQNKQSAINFSLVTNRQISPQLKEGIKRIQSGSKATPVLQKGLEKTTKLNGARLRAFCQVLSLSDGEDNYIVQREKLQGEMTEFIAGFIDSPEIDHLIALVSERALPHSETGRRKGEIVAEDVLKRVAGGSARLFPAPAEFEELPNIVPREQQSILLQKVLGSSKPTIIHAAGGVGKSVMARQMTQNLPHDSVAIVYDCFGGGKYRNESAPRHRACDALVQIANELATKGLCRPLLGHSGTAAEALFQEFLKRVKEATQTLREINKKAELIIVIDAGDNAEMAAEERGERSFVKGLLRESMPANCHLVVLCRTERVNSLDPPSSAGRVALRPFSRAETTTHLREIFSAASSYEVEEFHRLTGGNPRVQANALSGSGRRLSEVLLQLGPVGTSVDDQIAAQLQTAVSNLRDKSPKRIKTQVDAICLGLANLPPFIPVTVLAAVAGVDESAIHSFVSDLGRPLWHSNDSVQFRDEPTETWFRKQFNADTRQFKTFVAALEPLAANFTYVAKALPRLLLLSGNLKRLVMLSLSDDFLPKGNPIDERDVRVYRLQFAFKAALKLDRIADAVRLAFRAGEEMAGTKRQLELLSSNLDLIAPLQGSQKIEELAYSSKIHGSWTGSDNIYSASLLSTIEDFKGDAQSRLRAAERWLHIYIEERNKKPKKKTLFPPSEDKVDHGDILELTWARYNLYGPQAATKYFLSWTPTSLGFTVGRSFIGRLVDQAKLSDIDQIATAGSKSAYLLVAIADETSTLGYFPPKKALERSLNALLKSKTRIKRPEQFSYHDPLTPAIVSFAEACAARKLPAAKVLALLRYYTTPCADSRVADGYNESPRTVFVRAASLKSVLKKQYDPNLDDICFPKLKSPVTQEGHQRQKEMREVVGSLLPWYLLRARFICGDRSAAAVDLAAVRAKAKTSLFSRYQETEILMYEMSYAWFKVLALKRNVTQTDFDFFAQKVISRPDRKFRLRLQDRLEALRTAVQIQHLAPLRDPLEKACREILEQPGGAGTPEESSADYVRLARAVLAQSAEDAAVYFGCAVNAVSKFGDEMVQRWEALVSVARRAADGKADRRHLTYRFLQCAEIIGESVAREKYWDRDEVFRVALKMDAPSAFAGLSRWRDRDVGWFAEQLPALASQAIASGVISPTSGWCLNGFLGCSNSAEYAEVCVRAQPDVDQRQRTFDSAVADLLLNGASLKSWNKMLSLGVDLRLDQSKVKGLIAERLAAGQVDESATAHPTPLVDREKAKRQAQYKARIKGVDVMVAANLERLVDEQSVSDTPRYFELFWKEIIERVPRGKEKSFLQLLLKLNSLGYFEISYAVGAIQAAWSNRIAVSQYWTSFMFEVGKEFATAFSDTERRRYWLQMHPMDQASIDAFTRGIKDGLAERLELSEPATFFGFVSSVADSLSPEEARDALQFSLARFELHSDPEQGDGPWADWLKPPHSATEAFTGLVWAALGSPYGGMRWQAMHCVRSLAAWDCQKEIGSLVGWMQSAKVGAFGGWGLPFYDLHARQSLLIALNRAALENPRRLRPFSKVFAKLALSGMPHAFIQTAAARIADQIERDCSGTYPAAEYKALLKVGKTPFPVRNRFKLRGFLKVPWQQSKKSKAPTSPYFGLDFEPYWFKYLANVFGISGDTVTNLVREVALAYFKVSKDEGYNPDPRQHQWKNIGSRDRLTTYHSHGEYPSVDNYRFYYTYHSLMSVAMTLVQGMPVIRRDDWDEANPWDDWLGGHAASRSDGSWLADRRDSTPVKRRKWTLVPCEQDWQWEISAQDFLDVLTKQNPKIFPICVNGMWSDHRDYNVETIQISSALAQPQEAENIATLLRRSSPNDYWLPSYNDRDFEVRGTHFDVKGWVASTETSEGGLDRFDPHARCILYPPVGVGRTIAQSLNVTVDVDRRLWTASDSTARLISELWSDENIAEKDNQYRHGKRLCATNRLLRELCVGEKRTLIIDVRIRRGTIRRSSTEDDFGYVPPSHKVFTYSADGVLRDGAKQYAL